MQQRNSDPIDAGSNTQTSDQDFISSLLYTLALVESPTEEAFDKFTRLVTRALDVPVALVSFVEEERDRQVFKSQIGLDPEWAEQGGTGRNAAFAFFLSVCKAGQSPSYHRRRPVGFAGLRQPCDPRIGRAGVSRISGPWSKRAPVGCTMRHQYSVASLVHRRCLNHEGSGLLRHRSDQPSGRVVPVARARGKTLRRLLPIQVKALTPYEALSDYLFIRPGTVVSVPQKAKAKQF